MSRTIKRYGSRKLYDATNSRYISLQELADLIASGERVEVVDNQTGEDVTVQVLTQVISEQGRRGTSFPSGLLHDLIRAGEGALQASEEAVASRVRQVQQNVEGFVQRQVDRLRPVPSQEEVEQLRARLDALEAQLGRLSESESES